MSRLSACNVSFEQNERVIIAPLDLQIKQGELIGIIGPNGAGKSSLIRLLSGFASPTQGEVLLGTRSLQQIKGEERATKIAYLPQVSRVEFPYSVSEVVSLGLTQHRAFTRNEKVAAIRASLQQLGIVHLEHRQINALSGGEQQLVHIARILAQETSIMLLDEPCSSLDIGHEAQLMNLLALQASQGKSIAVALHNLNTAAEFCSRLVLLNQGKVVATGAPKQVLTKHNLEALYPNNVAVTYNSQTGNPNILPIKL
ncbi:ABC transporter ATP-binding protein [Vibrio gallicus]|uniref:ABC transporter ATP-binding protein n=1 Tax=Vibrio gallicus TaxID=190897 RepID=UPI0021C48724|nr:ABC transporter ATP-binding protein [Vibrio gallicus]